MHNHNNKRTKQNLIIFTVLVLGIATVVGVIEPLTFPLGARPGTSGLGQLLWLITPLVVMRLRIFGGDGWRGLGLRPNFKVNRFWGLVSILVIPVAITISVLVGALVGGLKLDMNMSSVFVAALLTGLISALIKNLFEEFAWRGYLAPKESLVSPGAEGIVSIVLMFAFGYWLHRRRRAGLESRHQAGAFNIADNTFKV
jgi:membrane protease YdiL (CAAX protease family)